MDLMINLCSAYKHQSCAIFTYYLVPKFYSSLEQSKVEMQSLSLQVAHRSETFHIREGLSLFESSIVLVHNVLVVYFKIGKHVVKSTIA